jgi:hypothetical protein
MLLRDKIRLSLSSLRRGILTSLSLRPRPIGLVYNPYDITVRQDLAEKLFETHEKEQPFGTIGRGRLILSIIEESFPTERLTAEYFENLRHLLNTRERRKVPGRFVLGVGPGRCGSTSLTALLATVEDSCCTHENPPLIFWSPEDAQVQFHLMRFRLLAEYFSLVADVSHWWLNALDSFLEHFPSSKIVGMLRDVDACTKSFMRIKGYGRQSWNHWVPYGSGIWASHSWDPSYPTYSVTSNSSPDLVKYELISRYVREYNAQLTALAERLPNQVLLVRTEDLSNPVAQMKVLGFADVRGRVSKLRLNVRTVTDGISENFKF